jgi:hypothetical protein
MSRLTRHFIGVDCAEGLEIRSNDLVWSNATKQYAAAPSLCSLHARRENRFFSVITYIKVFVRTASKNNITQVSGFAWVMTKPIIYAGRGKEHNRGDTFTWCAADLTPFPDFAIPGARSVPWNIAVATRFKGGCIRATHSGYRVIVTIFTISSLNG